ncbi:MAG: hypothetical protein IPK13_14010 [Deltaproteobacteria bacterium]|nr:hypothetical protein [Deltaproteobacteria bacterium]
MSRHWIAMVVFLGGAIVGIGSFARWGVERAAEKEQAESLRAQVAAILGGSHDPAEFPAMEKALSELLREHPENPTILLNLGILQGAQGQIDEAEASFSKVRGLDPQDYDALAELAAIAQLKGKTEAALDLLETIPPGKGRMVDRLRRDPNWIGLRSHPRMKALYEKHGLRPQSERSGSGS